MSVVGVERLQTSEPRRLLADPRRRLVVASRVRRYRLAERVGMKGIADRAAQDWRARLKVVKGLTGWLTVAGVAWTAAYGALPAEAIILHAWTFRELAAVSDAVLVVERVSFRDSGRRTRVPPRGYRFSSTPPVEAAEWEADLKVLLQLRPEPLSGDSVPPEIRMRYYRTDRSAGCLGCPAEIDLSADKGRHYLVFLRRVGGSLFEPASEDDMAIDSVFCLEHTGGLPIQWEEYLPGPPPSAPGK